MSKFKYLSVPTEVSASIHKNVSKGYYQIDSNGNRTFVPYDKNEAGEIHSFISPGKMRYRHMKWTKTHDWKDQEKAKKSKWKYTPIFGGLNTKKK
jgi:hypothetical protein